MWEVFGWTLNRVEIVKHGFGFGFGFDWELGYPGWQRQGAI
jgi:hypothetical protein